MDRPLVAAAQLAALALNRINVRYALCGGLAVAAHGFERATKDIDFLVAAEDIAAIDQALAPEGWFPTGATITFPDGMTLHRRMRMEGKRFMLLDLLVQPPGSTWLEQRKIGRLDGAMVWLVTREALIEMKRKAGRPQDLVDIGTLEEMGDDAAL